VTGRGGTKLHASAPGSRITAFLATAAPWEPYFMDNLRKSYIQDRYQRVLINFDSNKYYSKWEFVTVGVPQGSTLGSLLFLSYVNDLPNAMSDISNPVLYADDTSLIITHSDIQMFEKNINTVILRINR
jgi:hypothetical protein